MAGPTVTQPSQLLAGGAPASAIVTPNVRVRGQSGYVATAADGLLFPGATGSFVVPNLRTRTLGVPMISVSGAGLAVTVAAGTPLPISVAWGDSRIRSQ